MRQRYCVLRKGQVHAGVYCSLASLGYLSAHQHGQQLELQQWL